MKNLTSRCVKFVSALFLLSLVIALVACQSLEARSPSRYGQGLVLNSTSLQWSSVQVGTSGVQTATISNRTFSRITLTGAEISSPDFQIASPSFPVTLGPGQSISLSVKYAPGSAGSSSATITILSNSGMVSSVQLNVQGTAVAPTSTSSPTPTPAPTSGALTIQPASLSFGNVAIGTQQTISGALINSGGTSLTITQASISPSSFTINGAALPLTLAAGQSTNFTVTFTPAQSGAQAGTISIATTQGTSSRLSRFRTRASSVPQIFSASVSGTGVTPGQLAIGAASLSFGSIATGQSHTMPETITNSGGTAITVNQATVTGAGFQASGLTTPMTLAPGQSASFNVIFAPVAAGSASGTLAISSNAANGMANIALSGTGAAAGVLSLSSSSLAFSSTQIGSTQILTDTVTNTGGTSVTISQANASGTGFSVSGPSLPLTLAAGQSTSFTVKYAPLAAGANTGALIITSNASNPSVTVAFSGKAAATGELTSTPSSLSFGNVQTSSNGSQSATITNSGGSDVVISKAAVTGSGFSITGLSLPLTLVPGQSFTFGVQFAPQTTGAANGSLVITSNAGVANLTIALAGNGTSVGQLALSPAGLSFGSVTVGTTEQLNLKLSASGSNVTISSLAPSTSEYSISGPALPVVVPAGQSASFTVTFAPKASGNASATLAVASDASNSPVITLAGAGAAPPQHSVELSWNDSQNVSGYNIYRTTVSGTNYIKINSGLNPTANYVDSPVQAGSTYYYVTTAVDSSGKESGYSNEIQAVIPTP